MGMGMEVISGHVTAPSTTFTAWTVHTGNSLTIRNSDPTKKIWLLSAWADQQAAGVLRVRSPKLHDNVQGLRMDTVISEVYPLLPIGYKQQLYAQDTLVVEQTGSATAGDFESGALLVWYEDLPGQNARLIGYDDLMKKASNLVTVDCTVTTTTAGGYTGSVAINSTFDLLKANTDYALVGYLVSAECAVVRWSGVDVGNLGVGGPGHELNKQLTSEWFTRLARLSGVPTIPVFNSANKAGFTVDCVQDENAAAVVVTSILAEIGPNPTAK